MEYWQEQALLKKERELLKKEYPLIGTIVRYAGEYGVIVKDPKQDHPIDTHRNGYPYAAYLVRWDTKVDGDFEQFGQLEYDYIDSYEFKYINKDGSKKIQVS